MKSIRNQSKLLQVVDDLAFQADLLALHASVELAGAAENSLEFALVADEVRKLAGRGVRAAQASTLIEQIEQKIEQKQTF